MKSALLFYLNMLKDITDIVFELNPYDPYVANKFIGGKKMTIC